KWRRIYRNNTLIYTIRNKTDVTWTDNGRSPETITRIKLATQVTGGGVELFVAVMGHATGTNAQNLLRFYRSDDATAATPTWRVVFDSPGSRDIHSLPVAGTAISSGNQVFDDLFPSDQAIVHFSMVVDPGTPGIVYLGGDATPAIRENSSIYSRESTGRLFRVDTSSIYAPTGNPATDPARGDQLTSQQAPLPGPAAGMTAAAGAANSGALTDGTYQYVVTFIDGNGVESNPSQMVSVIVGGSGT